MVVIMCQSLHIPVRHMLLQSLLCTVVESGAEAQKPYVRG